jgi:hypothetical protein
VPIQFPPDDHPDLADVDDEEELALRQLFLACPSLGSTGTLRQAIQMTLANVILVVERVQRLEAVLTPEQRSVMTGHPTTAEPAPAFTLVTGDALVAPRPHVRQGVKVGWSTGIPDAPILNTREEADAFIRGYLVGTSADRPPNIPGNTP